MQHIKEVRVVFKTHLDVGFTNLASKVVEQYFEQFIPNVFSLKSENFSWTVGSWLIHEFLRKSDAEAVRKMEEAINNGRICWHAFPFTAYTEFMDRELLEYGLSLSKSLDQRFGKKTTAAKMTDVPGHTKAIIESLAKNGIKFLHLSKNPACIAPDVPQMFRWRDDAGNEIVVMYDKTYDSEICEIPGTNKAVLLSYTNDNLGPPPLESIENLFVDLQKRFPNAKIVASDLNAIGEIACSIAHTLPIVTEEMGDTWIHGVGVDPRNVSNYRAMLRLRKNFSDEDREKANDGILLVSEHTWGVDEKSYLKDHGNFIRTEFEAARKTPIYKFMEESWQEQRDYITNTVNSLSESAKRQAKEAISEYKTDMPDLTKFEKISDPFSPFSCGSYNLAFNGQGAICLLEKGETVLADQNHLWFAPMYEVFGNEDYDSFIQQYTTSQPDWAIEDLTKVGMGSANKKRLEALPELMGVYQKENVIVAVMEMLGDVHEKFGAPKTMTTTFEFFDNELKVDFAWYNKPANRVAEAIWLGVCLKENNLLLNKIGQWIDPLTVVKNGSRALHAVGCGSGIKAGKISIETLDSALVAPGETSLLNFDNAQPDLEKGLHFNLYNNIWGTNFSMWYDEDARFRFIIRF